jgi:hypothetical protein
MRKRWIAMVLVVVLVGGGFAFWRSGLNDRPTSFERMLTQDLGISREEIRKFHSDFVGTNNFVVLPNEVWSEKEGEFEKLMKKRGYTFNLASRQYTSKTEMSPIDLFRLPNDLKWIPLDRPRWLNEQSSGIAFAW